MCVPNYFDATNEILELQRDLHANDFAHCEAYTFGIRTFLFAFLFQSERVALRSMTRVSSRRLLTLQLSAFVFWRWRACLCIARLAGSTGISSFFLGVLNFGVTLFNFVGRTFVNFPRLP